MMTEAEFLEHLRKVDDFANYLLATARKHLNDGATHAAGLVLVTEFELRAQTRQWEATVPHRTAAFDEPLPAPVVPAASHRHDYEPSITRGETPPVCACGKKKSPNGRPRTQQIIAPGAGGSS